MLSPVTDLRSPSESDFLLLPVDLAEDLRVSLGAEEMRSLRANFWPLSEWVEGALGRALGCGEEGGFAFVGAVFGTASLFPDTPPDTLGARLGA